MNNIPGKVLSIIGQKFNKLLVIGFSHRNRHNKTFWNCLCDCGSSKIVSAGCLKNGYTSSCGCSNPYKFKDKTGNRYERLLVIRLHSYGGKGNNYWECLCDCGKTVIVEGGNLRAKRCKSSTLSCGCYQKDIIRNISQNNILDISGQKFNRWTAIKRIKVDNNRSLWYCKCECGKFGKVSTGALQYNRSKSCGCLCVDLAKAKTGENHPNWNKSLTPEERELSKNRGHNPQLHQWRKLIYERDFFTCQITGVKSTRKDRICAHHLESWNSNKELRFNIDNGIVLLKEIHYLFHSEYGSGNNTRKEFEEFKTRFNTGEFNNHPLLKGKQV